MAYVDFITLLHTSTRRDYLSRVKDKAACARVAKQFGKDYWDGDRRYGYGGFKYDGRQRAVAERMAEHYGLDAGASVLDIGCGKGYLLYELTQVVPGITVAGIDISQYAIDHAKEEVKPFLKQGPAQELPYAENEFDLVISINTFHNLYLFDLKKAIQEMERVGRGNKYLVVEGYRNEEEKVNLFYWQLTCECFFTVEEWEWLFQEWGYTGDYSFIFFE